MHQSLLPFWQPLFLFFSVVCFLKGNGVKYTFRILQIYRKGGDEMSEYICRLCLTDGGMLFLSMLGLSTPFILIGIPLMLAHFFKKFFTSGSVRRGSITG